MFSFTCIGKTILREVKILEHREEKISAIMATLFDRTIKKLNIKHVILNISALILIGYLSWQLSSLVKSEMNGHRLIFASMPAAARSEQSMIPLLLSSGLSTVDTSEVKLILFFPQSGIPEKVIAKLPKEWGWKTKILSTANGKQALTIAGSQIINKFREYEVERLYQEISHDVAAVGGQLFLDERIKEGIDPVRYLSEVRAEPQEAVVTGNLISIAAYQAQVHPSVRSGSNNVNMQIVVRPGKETGETVLTFPLLLEEF